MLICRKYKFWFIRTFGSAVKYEKINLHEYRWRFTRIINKKITIFYVLFKQMDFLKIWWVSHISHSKTQNSSIDTIPLSLIVLEIFHKNDFSTLTLNAVFTPQIWKRGKIKKHVFLIFRSSITYPKIKMIGGGHLKYSPCK